MAFDVRFTKGHGTGNDFVLFADPDGANELNAERVRVLADRHFGVGADGVIRAVRAANIFVGLGQAKEAEWFMDYWNADGTTGEMCGNGIRVFVAYLIDAGLIDLPVGAAVKVGTRAGVKTVTRTATGYEADLGVWKLDGSEPLVRGKGLAVSRPGLGIDVGNPHVVVAVADDEELDGIDLTYVPRLDPEPEAGANVEFVVPAEPLVENGTGRIRMRVHERGSGETLSCGTGAVASALAVRSWAGAGAPDIWRVQVPGGVLGVRVVAEADGEHVLLSGPAELVFDGVVTLA